MLLCRRSCQMSARVSLRLPWLMSLPSTPARLREASPHLDAALRPRPRGTSRGA